MAKPGARFDERSIVASNCCTVHMIQLDDEMTILTTKSVGSVAVPATLCRHLDMVSDTTENCILNMFCCHRVDQGSGREVHS